MEAYCMKQRSAQSIRVKNAPMVHFIIILYFGESISHVACHGVIGSLRGIGGILTHRAR
jgi:hypothetical protein